MLLQAYGCQGFSVNKLTSSPSLQPHHSRALQFPACPGQFTCKPRNTPQVQDVSSWPPAFPRQACSFSQQQLPGPGLSSRASSHNPPQPQALAQPQNWASKYSSLGSSALGKRLPKYLCWIEQHLGKRVHCMTTCTPGHTGFT